MVWNILIAHYKTQVHTCMYGVINFTPRKSSGILILEYLLVFNIIGVTEIFPGDHSTYQKQSGLEQSFCCNIYDWYVHVLVIWEQMAWSFIAAILHV